MKIEPGYVVYCRFPTEEGGVLAHYAFVLTVEDTVVGRTLITVAYGSSKKVSVSGCLPHEFVLHEPHELRRAGLHRPTRFDLRKTAKLPAQDVEVTGSVDLADGRIRTRLKRALQDALG